MCVHTTADRSRSALLRSHRVLLGCIAFFRTRAPDEHTYTSYSCRHTRLKTNTHDLWCLCVDTADDDGDPGRDGTWKFALFLVVVTALWAACLCCYLKQRLVDPGKEYAFLAWLGTSVFRYCCCGASKCQTASAVVASLEKKVCTIRCPDFHTSEGGRARPGGKRQGKLTFEHLWYRLNTRFQRWVGLGAPSLGEKILKSSERQQQGWRSLSLKSHARAPYTFPPELQRT